jgi:hypothetical protein
MSRNVWNLILRTIAVNWARRACINGLDGHIEWLIPLHIGSAEFPTTHTNRLSLARTALHLDRELAQ